MRKNEGNEKGVEGQVSRPGAEPERAQPAEKDQRDPQQKVQHMPRHWQGPGTRGEAPGQPPPEPDRREPGRANQYGTTGEIAGRQVHEELTEHGRETPPQRRENEQLPKRPGERQSNVPTPKSTSKKPEGQA